MENENMIYFGDEVKALGEGRVGGYLVRFSTERDPDLQGDFFTKSTDFGRFAETDVYYQHGMDSVLGKRVIGAGTLKTDDAGVWVEAQLNLRDEYEQRIYEMAKAGKLGWSSGTAGHLVERERVGKSWHIKRWVLGADASLTPTPAEPRTRVLPLKTFMVSDEQPEAEPEARERGDAAKQADAVIEILRIETSEEEPVMADVTNTPPVDRVDQLEAKMDGVSQALTTLLSKFDNEPVAYKSGLVATDGAGVDRNIKSLPDFLMTVFRTRENRQWAEKRLAEVYDVKASALTGESGQLGGYALPESYSTELLQAMVKDDPILNKITVLPVASRRGTYPIPDVYATPSAGESALAAGLTSSSRVEGGAYTQVDVGINNLRYDINDAVSGYIKASVELTNDARTLEALIREFVTIAGRAKAHYYVLRGTGVGQPLGVFNSGALVDVTPATNNVFARADVSAMLARAEVQAFDKAMWVAHRTMIPDLDALDVTTGTAEQTMVKMRDGIYYLRDYPVVFSPHVPQADSSGCINLIDWSGYRLFQLEALTVRFSEHADFLNGNNVWVFDHRLDGQPTRSGTIKDSGGYATSHFVRFND